MKRLLLSLLASGLVIVSLAGTPEKVSASVPIQAQQTISRAAQSGWSRVQFRRWRRGWVGPRYRWRGGWGWYGRPYRWGYGRYRTYWGPYWGGYSFYRWPVYNYGGYSVTTPFFGIWW